MNLHEKVFGQAPEAAGYAPGRVNLIGEYTDLIGGNVLPMPLSKGITVSVSRAARGTHVFSAIEEETRGIDLADGPAGSWTDYAAGPLVIAAQAGIAVPPLNLSIESDLPAGAGVSSSAALEVAVLRALFALLESERSGREIAQLAQRAENEFCGVQCGIMDQMAVAVGDRGHALALDCGTLDYEQVAIPPDWTFAVIHCGIARQLVDGAYNERRAALDEAARVLGPGPLKDKPVSAIEGLSDPLDRRRTRHVLSEQARTVKAADALRKADAALFGRLMNESHASLQSDFDVSTPSLDRLVDAARSAGAFGARVTGAGFGGCIVALVPTDRKDAWWQAVSARCPDAWPVEL
ncbi:MAG: galactokinase [Parvibaculaceae bacterium]